ncbi:gp58-like family protein [Lactobacillus delbrueckii]|uniref:gp58-like family protein n=1 Tax=Lactobacillus delbrueckii TaxID=1584 RepID=UPI00177EE54F|nr:gp58-like family protein [Lactobacillus delbrueckii]MBD5834704.1 hypothetical protein [Lactobacillus delbrueckii]
MLSQTDVVKQAWAAANRTLDIIVTVDGKDYQSTEINSLNYDAGAFTGDTLGIGSTYENSVTIEFSSVVEAFKQGLTVLPKVGVLVNGKFEYTKLGTFIVSEVNRDRNNNLTTIKALDQMCKLEGQYKPTVSDTASPLDIIADIANQGGVTVNMGDLQHLPTLPNVKRIEGQTLRTAIGWVAQLYDGFATFDRDGKLTIRTTASPDYTITPGEYQQGGLTKNEVAYKTGGIKVTVNTKKTDDSGQEVDDTTTLQAGETTGSQIELTNDSMTNDLLTTVWTGIKDITYYPYTLNWFGNPNLEAGDWVTLTDTQGNQFNVPVNQYTMSFNGGLESTISATQSSSTAGGYAYTGSAGSIKNMIEALQVRHTASGNNVYPPSYQGEPKNPKKGDVWYKQNGNNVEVWIYQEDNGTLAWVRTPIDGEIKAELQALGAKTDEDLTRVKSELSKAVESQWSSAKTAISETSERMKSLQAENKASLSELYDTANSLSQTVKDGSRNLIKTAMELRLENSDEKVGDYVVGLVNAGNGVLHEDDTQAPLSVVPPNLDGKKLTVGFDVLVSNVSQLGSMYVNLGVFNGQGTRVLELTNVSFENKGVTAGKWTRISNTFDIPQDWVSGTIAGHDGSIITDHTGNQIEATLSGWYYSIQFKNAASISYNVKCVQAEIGPNATAFAAPDSSIGQLIQTSKELRNLISNNDGNISQLRQTANSLQTQVANNRGSISSLEQTASGLTSRVSSAEGNISSLQQTANGLTSEIKDAKDNISSLQQTAFGITSRVSNAEGNISSLQQTANRLSATVGDANSGLVSDVIAMPGKITSAIVASQQAKVITTATDIHDMKTAGYYLLKGTLTNSPVDAWAFLRVITSDSGDRIYHKIWKDNSSTVYTEEWTGEWSDWSTHINADNLKSNVITAINQSTEGVSITGAKITLDGNVNVAPGFTLSADYINTGKMKADRISGGTLNFNEITVTNGLTANSISSGSISGQNLNINLDNGVVEFTKGNLHSTDGGFNISIDTKSFYLDMGNGSKLWIDSNGFHLQESASQHLWMNKDGLHNYTDTNGNGIQINDTELKVLNSDNAGLVAKDGMLQFSANPTWNSDNVYYGSLDSQTYGTIGFASNLLSSSLNGLFIKGREGVVIGTNSYGGGSLFGPDGYLDVGEAGSGINLPDSLNQVASIFTKSALTLLGGPTYTSGALTTKAQISIGCDTYYTHSNAGMYSNSSNTRGNNILVRGSNVNIQASDWVNIKSDNSRIAVQAQYFHSYPTYNQTTSAGANVFVAPDGALVRSSSARKYKTDIQDAGNDYGAKLIEFTPQKWIDKAEKKHYEEDPEKNKKPDYYYGLIADDLDAAGLDMLVNYGKEGEVEGINYDRLAVALLPVIKSLKDQVASLKEQLKALNK